MLRLSDFDYELPKELIAQHPLRERDSARLMVLDRKKGGIRHCVFKDIAGYLNKDDLLVLNDTKVLPCRLRGQRLSGGKVELLLLGRREGGRFKALIKPGRLKSGEKIVFAGDKTYAVVGNKNEVTFNAEDPESIYRLGAMPLPPYIKREPQDTDSVYYQTVYASEDGAVAAPTAGLHFTQELIRKLTSCGVDIAYITLHVGYATFKPVKAEDITMHRMEPEYFRVPAQAVKLIEEARKGKNRIIATGTTSLRALEAYACGRLEGDTDLFIYPGYKFKIAGSLLTNFHLPRTTLFMLVCAFAGRDFIQKAYQEAIAKKYRFYSYGDAMFIL